MYETNNTLIFVNDLGFSFCDLGVASSHEAQTRGLNSRSPH